MADGDADDGLDEDCDRFLRGGTPPEYLAAILLLVCILLVVAPPFVWKGGGHIGGSPGPILRGLIWITSVVVTVIGTLITATAIAISIANQQRDKTLSNRGGCLALGLAIVLLLFDGIAFLIGLVVGPDA